MERKSMTTMLYILLFLAAAIGLFMLTMIVPGYAKEATEEMTGFEWFNSAFVIFIAISAIPYYFALGNAAMIVREIGADNSFSYENAKRLKKIGYCAAAFATWYFIGFIPISFIPGLDTYLQIVIACIVFLSLAASAAAVALSHLTAKAAEIKNENDMTI